MKAINQSFSVPYAYSVVFTRGVFVPENTVLSRILRKAGQKRNRMLVVADSNLVDSNPGLLERIKQYGEHHRDILEFVGAPFIVRGGEVCKNEPREVEKIRALTEERHVCRHSFILVMGGGAVLDAVGYAAATAHRGIRLIRMPTTTLAQNDAGVGVKNGINAFGKKNYLGTFVPPYAVINDFEFLNTLSARDRRAGIAEAVKVALIKDGKFFDRLYRERRKLASFEPVAMERMIIRCAELHLEHIRLGGDPFEYGTSRPLDFGHWSAHRIEEVSRASINHGEAVALGIALDSLYSYHKGMIGELELNRILLTLEDVGFDLYSRVFEKIDMEKALKSFQEHLGGELTIVLLEGIGKKRDVHEIDVSLMKKCVKELAARKNNKEKGYENSL
jgi:3-dehydroquinate synthase